MTLCSQALGAVQFTTNTGGFSGAPGSMATVSPSVSLTPTFGRPGVLISVMLTQNGDTPEDHQLTTPTGFTFLEGNQGTTGAPGDPGYTFRSSLAFATAYEAVASVSGLHTAAATYLKGFGNTGWWAFLMAFRTGATSPVQSMIHLSTTLGLTTVTLDAAPTNGNFLIAVVVGAGATTITPSESGWTTITTAAITQPGDLSGTRKKVIGVYCRCYTTGDGADPTGQTWGFGVNNNQGGAVTISEWVAGLPSEFVQGHIF